MTHAYYLEKTHECLVYDEESRSALLFNKTAGNRVWDALRTASQEKIWGIAQDIHDKIQGGHGQPGEAAANAAAKDVVSKLDTGVLSRTTFQTLSVVLLGGSGIP